MPIGTVVVDDEPLARAQLQRLRRSRVARADVPPAVVFVTAYERYALKAFEAEALDYLLNPFADSRFFRVSFLPDPSLRDRHLSRVRDLCLDASGEHEVVLRDETRLKVSRGYRDKLQAALQGGR